MTKLYPGLFSIMLLLCLSCSTTKQKAIGKFKGLSRPEKYWVVTHPFVAKRSLTLSRLAVSTSEKVKHERLLDQENNGGKLDAFRHAYWMALLTQNIGPRKAEKLGKAHEKGNWHDFKKHRLEEGVLPDSNSTVMDLYNNKEGIVIGCENLQLDKDSLKNSIIKEINKGRFKIIAKNKEGNFVDCAGNKLDPESLKGKWNNNKCLVNSDYVPH